MKEDKKPFQIEKQTGCKNLTGSCCCQTESQLISDSTHLVIHAPVKKKATTTDNRRSYKQNRPFKKNQQQLILAFLSQNRC